MSVHATIAQLRNYAYYWVHKTGNAFNRFRTGEEETAMTSAYDQGVVPPIEMRHRLRIAREYADLEQAGLALLMGVTRSTVSNAEQGKVSPQRTTLNLWALACGVPVTWIRTGAVPADGPDNGPTYGLGIIRPDGPSLKRVSGSNPTVTRKRRRSAVRDQVA